MAETTPETGAPRISVVVPAYNRAGTIERAIRSVLTQDFDGIEVIVVDDGSTDETRDIVRAIKDPRLRLVERPGNGGAGAARNAGMEAARAPMVAFLDSDDEFLPGKLASQYAAMKAAGPDYRMSCTAYRIELLDQGRIIEGFHTPRMVERDGLMKGCSLGPGSTLMFERRVFTDIGGFDTTLRRFEDWEWVLRYYARGGRILIINTILSHVYNRRGKLSDENFVSAERFIARRDALFPDAPARVRREADFQLWMQVVGTAYYAGAYRWMARALVRAIAAKPLGVVERGLKFVTGRTAQQVSDDA